MPRNKTETRDVSNQTDLNHMQNSNGVETTLSDKQDSISNSLEVENNGCVEYVVKAKNEEIAQKNITLTQRETELLKREQELLQALDDQDAVRKREERRFKEMEERLVTKEASLRTKEDMLNAKLRKVQEEIDELKKKESQINKREEEVLRMASILQAKEERVLAKGHNQYDNTAAVANYNLESTTPTTSAQRNECSDNLASASHQEEEPAQHTSHPEVANVHLPSASSPEGSCSRADAEAYLPSRKTSQSESKHRLSAIHIIALPISGEVCEDPEPPVKTSGGQTWRNPGSPISSPISSCHDLRPPILGVEMKRLEDLFRLYGS